MRVGLIGCGRISDIYLKNCRRFKSLDVVACASLDLQESRNKADEYGIALACNPEELLADTSIDAVLNLTIPAAHSDISRSALMAGKHVYSEKPFVTDLTEGRELINLASERGLLIGNAPDTFLGGRWQTCRRLIDEGLIGKPTGVSAFVGTHGVERHNPNPDFYYQHGAGPLLDLGPYYLTALVFLLGPIERVCGLSRRTFDWRMIENGPRNGEWMPVDVDTHSLSLLEFSSGVIGTMTMSFDVWDSDTPRLEIYGEKGTLCIPDPDPVHGANVFGGEVWYRTRETSTWTHQPRPQGREQWQIAQNWYDFNEDSRGVGLLDLALAVHEGRSPRASADLAYHVCDVMTSIQDAPVNGTYQKIESACKRPEPLPFNFSFSQV